jgi:peptidoglycan/xylan/chitin deacetylase (PgdA/CDA1 family)
MIPILLYHQIADVPAQRDPLGLAIAPRQFEQHMAFLQRAGYRCLSLPEAVRYLQEGRSLPRKSFVLTFDDGYRDLIVTVAPILNRFGFTATVFLVAGCMGGGSDWEGQRGARAAPLLSWAEARELAAQGFTFGGHTLTHPRLTGLHTEQVLHEIRQSNALIEEQLEIKSDFFAYPYHDSDARIQRIVAGSGYRAACGSHTGTWGLYNLWRAECMRDDGPMLFKLKAEGRYLRLRYFIQNCQRTPVGSLLVRPLRAVRRWQRGLKGAQASADG